VLVVCSLGFGAWTALAQTITTTTSDPLLGSQFQGGDGNQDNATGLIDWHGLQADGQVDHTSDPNAQDNIFHGGSEELNPGDWDLTTQNGGANPSSANILDIYRTVDHPRGGDVFLYLAFTREASDGTVFVTFELNQDIRLWTNSQGARIPCRTTGDLQISYEPHGNGASIHVNRWVTDHAASNGCATDGHLESADLSSSVVQASFNNDAGINNFLPGFYTSSIPQLNFGEAAINVSNVLRGLNHPCAVFGSTWAHSRSSDSVTSDMKDYVAPEAFKVRTCKADTSLSSTASGTVNRRARGKHRLRRHRSLRATTTIFDTAHLSGGDDPTGTITFRLYGPNDAGCSRAPVFESSSKVVGNGDYMSGTFTPTAAGTYRWRVEYSGDQNNQAAGPTGCGEDTETVVVAKATPTLSSTASGTVQLPGGRRPGGRRHRRVALAVRTAKAPTQIYDTANLDGGISPTGTLHFKLYGPNDATCSGEPIFTSDIHITTGGLHNSDPFTPTRAGTYRWRVSYSGDDNNKAAGPTECGVAAETVDVKPATPTIVTVASPAVVLGDSIKDSATLSDGAHPTGTIAFHVYGPNDADCNDNPADTSTVDVSGNGTYDSKPFTPTAEGTYRWVAIYSGDGNNESTRTSCGDVGEQVVVASKPPPPPPDLTTTASPSAPAGSRVHDTAVLSGGSDPTGTITFRVYGANDDDCTGAPAAISTVAVSHGNGSYDSHPFIPSAAGTYRWVASYSGDDNNGAVATACNDANESVVVTRATPAIRTVALPVVPIGAVVLDAARLTGGVDPHGVIIFRLYGPDNGTCARPTAFTVVQKVHGNGLYRSPTVAPQRAGTYRWVATYAGDRNNERAATACGDAHETVVVRPRHPLLTTSASPAANLRPKAPRTQQAGGAIYDAATLRHAFMPTGEITFALHGPDDPSCSGDPIFTTATAVNGNGVYNSEHFTATVSGDYRWVATYSGDDNNRRAGPTACGDDAEIVHVTVPAQPVLSTSASAAVTAGGAVHDTAHLSGGAAPTGTITFRLYGAGDSNCSGDPLFTSTVKVSGNGDYDSESFVSTKAGVYQWVAAYSGDGRNKSAGPTACGDTAELAIVRSPAITPVTPTFSTTSSVSPGLGAPMYDVAHLSGAIAPFGTITFSLYGPDDTTCSRPPLFTTTTAVMGNGDYRSTPFVAGQAGTYRWVASYTGDAMNNGVGPTACGLSAETTVVAASVGPDVNPGPNVKPPREPAGPPHHKPKPKPPPPPKPIVTG
jgi:hypothetical protein